MTMVYKRPQKGFTLVEIIVVIAIIGLILPAMFSIVFTLLRLQIQISQLQRLKEVGDFVTNQMTYTIRTNAHKVDETCLSEAEFSLSLAGASESVMFRDRSDNCFGYYIKDNQLASISAVLNAPSYSQVLISNSDTDFPVTVNSEDSSLEKIETRLAKIKLSLSTIPRVSYLPTQTLTYQLFTYLRN
ncbi:hypothetical protein A2313_03670 [Candidatus Roizmanbacteria bacterium RIFOXYB2_FULL_41_10]|uniref:Prepilin-type N-terminal cleavage/methylation domain-containing protein n=1 Tax=Candidatus Roizmanbacteria bacterium RIFOXYA1_FULL_41_12 TaxID=1802082 RepID=A0A1F7KEL8_9BACT|nr:MAG: hypothetical protein A2209_02000 [Candidatus Roizmanbacteria bacterium RIFOXYA1_FULL_41_12]OGK66652.1 MAG: hypothetical protein A2262_01610 [Candidatus Roizmanbacteria bacterium RIFOXYA2_FULL_41_8]OGK69029.1 MAG: hypothetical protein A2313_03670 [Candidatus Roizmanbacteria bacterium RIFOXYB2_FULL_41_10]OGK71514.1 MAG: hypothetical protein A2403_00725 [Candidatus Roizmanbacteria bacterium RIFOXYC1_FULL_41_16]